MMFRLCINKDLQNEFCNGLQFEPTSSPQDVCMSKRETPQEISSALRKTATICPPVLQVRKQNCT